MINSIRSTISRLFDSVLSRDTTQMCVHEKDDIWPSEDAGIWYLRNKTENEETHWSERDVAYILQRGVTKEFICTGCGEERTIETSTIVGGEEGIKLKTEMSEDELNEFKNTVHVGAFTNGFP